MPAHTVRGNFTITVDGTKPVRSIYTSLTQQLASREMIRLLVEWELACLCRAAAPEFYRESQGFRAFLARVGILDISLLFAKCC